MGDLDGLRIVLTRPRGQIEASADEFRKLGADVVEMPTIAIEPADDNGEALRRALELLPEYKWCVFTSVNTVQVVFEVLNVQAFHGVLIAAIGVGTAQALEERGVFVDLVPKRFVAEALVEAFPEADEKGGKVLLPRAAVARNVLPEGLREKGWVVDVVVAYKTSPIEITDEQREIARGSDLITFTSPSTVNSFMNSAGNDALPATIACIGPITHIALVTRGVSPEIVADEHSIKGLVDAIVAWRRTAT